jgi:D-alanyl-D-alanine carboxypeptidase
MPRTPPSARTTPRRVRWLLVLGLVAVTAAITVALGYQAPKHWPAAAAPPNPPRGERGALLGEADGVVPDRVTVLDDTVPAVTNLDPGLLQALRRAATDAADDGIEFYVNSGWRSPEYQDQLLREAVAEYGSEDEAARWVATAATSPHVAGDAVDLGDSEATAWLSEHGAEYGLCQIYRNEPWHYELRTEAMEHGCPRMYADPTEDPRTQQ